MLTIKIAVMVALEIAMFYAVWAKTEKGFTWHYAATVTITCVLTWLLGWRI